MEDLGLGLNRFLMSGICWLIKKDRMPDTWVRELYDGKKRLDERNNDNGLGILKEWRMVGCLK